jgi:hypothetical protein
MEQNVLDDGLEMSLLFSNAQPSLERIFVPIPARRTFDG